jgi:hypothetical protein
VTEHELARQAGLFERTILRFEAGLARPRPVTPVALRRGFRKLSQEDAQNA